MYTVCTRVPLNHTSQPRNSLPDNLVRRAFAELIRTTRRARTNRETSVGVSRHIKYKSRISRGSTNETEAARKERSLTGIQNEPVVRWLCAKPSTTLRAESWLWQSRLKVCLYCAFGAVLTLRFGHSETTTSFFKFHAIFQSFVWVECAGKIKVLRY